MCFCQSEHFKFPSKLSTVHKRMSSTLIHYSISVHLCSYRITVHAHWHWNTADSAQTYTHPHPRSQLTLILILNCDIYLSWSTTVHIATVVTTPPDGSWHCWPLNLFLSLPDLKVSKATILCWKPENSLCRAERWLSCSVKQQPHVKDETLANISWIHLRL